MLQDRFDEPWRVVSILQQGPEPLQSHFATGYGMVLKLLHHRSLDFARAFVERSFFNYLGALSCNIRSLRWLCRRRCPKKPRKLKSVATTWCEGMTFKWLCLWVLHSTARNKGGCTASSKFP